MSPSGVEDVHRWFHSLENTVMGTDFAFMNPGGIRDNIAAGKVRWGELFNMGPVDLDALVAYVEQLPQPFEPPSKDVSKLCRLERKFASYH